MLEYIKSGSADKAASWQVLHTVAWLDVIPAGAEIAGYTLSA